MSPVVARATSNAELGGAVPNGGRGDHILTGMCSTGVIKNVGAVDGSAKKIDEAAELHLGHFDVRSRTGGEVTPKALTVEPLVTVAEAGEEETPTVSPETRMDCGLPVKAEDGTISGELNLQVGVKIADIAENASVDLARE